jgi:hypothetical protein
MWRCPLGLAPKATHLIFSQTEEIVSVNDVQNATEEMTNMIGSNIKALCPALTTVLQVTCSRV